VTCGTTFFSSNLLVRSSGKKPIERKKRGNKYTMREYERVVFFDKKYERVV